MKDVPNTAQVRAARDLLLNVPRLSGEALSKRLGQARNRDYWRGLNPGLSVETRSPQPDEVELPAEIRRQCVNEFSTAGYCQTEQFLNTDVLARMHAAIDRLHAEGWPPVFGWVYDEFWSLIRSKNLQSLAESILGRNYRQTSYIWCNHVPAVPGAAGWPPHIDGPGTVGQRLNIWIPLTDATLDNGCLYLVPKDVLPDSLLSKFSANESFEYEDMSTLLQGAHAMPLKAGEILIWDFHQIIHWGSRYTRGDAPRVSITFEFIGDETVPADNEPPLLDATGPLPGIESRLRFIAKAIRVYQSREPERALPFLALAQRLEEES